MGSVPGVSQPGWGFGVFEVLRNDNTVENQKCVLFPKKENQAPHKEYLLNTYWVPSQGIDSYNDNSLSKESTLNNSNVSMEIFTVHCWFFVVRRLRMYKTMIYCSRPRYQESGIDGFFNSFMYERKRSRKGDSVSNRLMSDVWSTSDDNQRHLDTTLGQGGQVNVQQKLTETYSRRLDSSTLFLGMPGVSTFINGA